ncbi:hypothetical protein TBLA_0B05480 [Henningerozyma blattae CBS 6284]|uniref:TLC domain-containing protein n=1 Tax=Henningerozyma blattae (strain ATCC 34711 / CBS 6284 / DSM 70876 / NBRC 10599 / NRRL Y-10934 / UCD 77-7) TaxID=1071380 RepID=I2GZ25_HENB6|nr:hypothetical protein TBLA_0B05480 [Tetrapisispora blattae CBS 6284]CCH59377.1 hypothetical protein TBLA_0B05480 [Tetrapisispora blattae CBS 6284]
MASNTSLSNKTEKKQKKHKVIPIENDKTSSTNLTKAASNVFLKNSEEQLLSRRSAVINPILNQKASNLLINVTQEVLNNEKRIDNSVPGNTSQEQPEILKSSHNGQWSGTTSVETSLNPDSNILENRHPTSPSKTSNSKSGNTSSRLSMVGARIRSGSSVGKIHLGDTNVHSLGTMGTTKASRSASQARLKVIKSKSKTKLDTLKKVWVYYRELGYQNTWLNPLLILFFVYSTYFYLNDYTEKNPLHKFIRISYYIKNTNCCKKGFNDLCFIFFHMIVFTFLREFIMEIIIKPLTKQLRMQSQHKIERTMEQAYSVVYYSFSAPAGMLLMYNSPLWFFNTTEMYRTYPDIIISSQVKWYYLLQASFWSQQAAVLVLQLEKPRKDQNEMIYHHIVTLTLILSSYMFHYTKMGLEIYASMDISDLLLATSKTLNYLEFAYTPVVFALFVISWIYCRHYINAKILWSVLTEYRTVGNYTLNYATQQYKCYISLPIVFTLIFALQLVNLYWLHLIFKVLYRVIFEGIQEDNRSEHSSNEYTEQLTDASSITTRETTLFDEQDNKYTEKKTLPKIEINN